MNENLEEELLIEEIEYTKAKTELCKSATWLISIISAAIIISAVIFIFIFSQAAEIGMKLFN